MAGILGDPRKSIDPEEELGGILGKLKQPDLSQMMIAMGGQLAANADRGWAAGIGGGFNAIANMQQGNLDDRLKLTSTLADINARREQTAANAPWRQAQMDNWQSLIRSRDADSQIMQQLMGGGLGGGAPVGGSAQAPPASPIQPQSFTPGPQGAMPPNPLLQQVADQGAPMPPAQAPGAASAPQPDIIDTPYGRLPRERALQLGGQLMLNPKYSTAGKALVEQAQGGKTPGIEDAVRNKIDEKEFNSGESLSRLTDIEKKFDPKFLTMESMAKNYGVSWLDSIDSLRKNVPPEALNELSRFTEFKQAAQQNINLYIKEITGAQMSEAEAERLTKAAPDPNKDSPTQFWTKMQSSIKEGKRATARYRYLRAQGFTGKPWEAMPLEYIDGLVNKRGAALEQQLKQQNPHAGPQALRGAVQQQLKQEFGI